MSAATHLEIDVNPPRRAGGWGTAVTLFSAGALLLSACSSGSDAATLASTEPVATSANTEPAATSANTEPAATTAPIADTTPATGPPETDPAPVTTEAPLAEIVVAEGTAFRVEGSQINGPAGPDGRIPTESRAIYEGGLTGEMGLTGSFLVGEDTIEVLLRGDFTGEVVGVGSGTFVTESTSSIRLDDRTGEGTGTVLSGTGAFADLRGTSTLTITDLGADFSYRFEFTPVDEVTDRSAD